MRAIARNEARDSKEPIRWKGAGDYSYEMTPEGVRVTGGEKSKTLTGGRSTMLSFDNHDPRNLDMLEAVVREWRTQVLGPLPEPPPKVARKPASESGIMRSPSGGLISYPAKPPEAAKQAKMPEGNMSTQAARSSADKK